MTNEEYIQTLEAQMRDLQSEYVRCFERARGLEAEKVSLVTECDRLRLAADDAIRNLIAECDQLRLVANDAIHSGAEANADGIWSELERVAALAVSRWGLEAQTWKALEELAELTEAIALTRTKSGHWDAVVHECADVIIMCFQLADSWSKDGKFRDIIEGKLARLEERVKA